MQEASFVLCLEERERVFLLEAVQSGNKIKVAMMFTKGGERHAKRHRKDTLPGKARLNNAQLPFSLILNYFTLKPHRFLNTYHCLGFWAYRDT